MDALAAFALAVPFLDVAGADFELECARDAVPNREGVRLVDLAVDVQVDEAGGDDEPRGVDQALAVQGLFADGFDTALPDTDVPYLVEPGFGVDDPAAVEHDIVELVLGLRGYATRETEQTEDKNRSLHDAAYLNFELRSLSTSRMMRGRWIR